MSELFLFFFAPLVVAVQWAYNSRQNKRITQLETIVWMLWNGGPEVDHADFRSEDE